jgi:hypothetical protein
LPACPALDPVPCGRAAAASSADGFVERIVYAEVPVRVEYSLTALGWSATELLMALADWADEHLAAVEQARLRYREASVFSADSAADLSYREAA